MSQSTVIEPDGEPILVSLPDGTTLAIIVHAHVEEGEESCPVVSDAELTIHRYTETLDDLNDITACLLREASANGHTALQRSCINILNIACSAREWLNAEERRMRERGEAER